MSKLRSNPKLFWVMAALVLIVAILIFKFSAQDSSASDDLSIGFASFLFEKIFGNEFAENANHFIRKCAHFSIYLALGFCLRGTFYKSKFKKDSFMASIITAFCCFLYAATDEIHQYFVPGRSCSVLDVMLDTVGAVCGIMIAYLIFEYKKVKRKNY